MQTITCKPGYVLIFRKSKRVKGKVIYASNGKSFPMCVKIVK